MLIPASNASVFIGYRRADTGHAAARLHDELKLMGHRVWLDLDAIGPAVVYRSLITKALRECEVALILIGPQWLTACDDEGTRRLDDPEDDVRLEIELALQRPDVTLVPVLVDGAKMPSRSEVPDSLRPLCDINAARLSRETWRYQVLSLHETIESAARRGWRSWGEALGIAAVAAVPAAVLAATGGLRTDTSNLQAGENLARLAGQRALLWGLIVAAVLMWVALRRPGQRWASALRAGLLYGAAFGAVGALVHAIPTYIVTRDQWSSWGLESNRIESVHVAAYALGVGATGAGIGALIGAAWNPPGVKRGLLAGLAAGGLLGWLVREHIGGEATQTKILTSILVAVGIVGAAIATEWITRATSASSEPS